MEQNEWICTVNKCVLVLSFSSPRCTILSILTSLFLTRIYIFLTQYRPKRSYTRAYTHPYERTRAHAHTLPLWAHPKDRAGISSWNLWSHHRHLIVNRNVSSHWMHIAGNPEINRGINASTRTLTLVGSRNHYPPNHLTTGWLAPQNVCGDRDELILKSSDHIVLSLQIQWP